MNIPRPSRRSVRQVPRAVIVLAVILSGAARAETRSAAPASTVFHACDGAKTNSSVSIHDDDGKQKWTIKLEGASCKIDFRMEGKARFNDDFTDLVSLPPDGSFRIDVTSDGERRELEITPQRNGLQRTWKVNGHEQPYDDAARTWLGSFLVELDRRTAVGVDQRLPNLLAKGGVTGVLAETAQMPSDYARNIYYSKLATATHLSSADVVRVFDQAASIGTSDYYGAELLKGLGVHAGDDAKIRAAMFRMIQSMTSDYYRAESVRQAIGSGKLGAREVDFLVSVLQDIDSDYYKDDVLKQVLAAGSSAVTEADLLAIVKAVAPTKSDYYRAEMLRHVVTHPAATDPVRRAALDATGGMSTYYREEVEKASARR
jgi:hypothetical protein